MRDFSKFDAQKHHVIATKRGPAMVDKSIEPIPAAEYFEVEKLPSGMEAALVYPTKAGPVIAHPMERQNWSEEHAERAETFARDLKGVIDAKGRYRPALSKMAAKLSQETGWELEAMETVIVEAFERQNEGKDPYRYLGAQRKSAQISKDPDWELD